MPLIHRLIKKQLPLQFQPVLMLLRAIKQKNVKIILKSELHAMEVNYTYIIKNIFLAEDSSASSSIILSAFILLALALLF